MNPDEAFQQLRIAVQNPQHGPRQIARLASAGFDLNYTPHSRHPVFDAIDCYHFNIVNVLIDHGVRFDHRDPSHQNVSVIRRLRSNRDFFESLLESPDHKETRGINRRCLEATKRAIGKYDRLVAEGTIETIEDAPELTGAELANQLEENLKGIPGISRDALHALLAKLRAGT